MKGIFFFGFLFFSSSMFSQDTTWKKPDAVVIHKDPRIDSLIKKQAQINEEVLRMARRNTKGFRILVINTNNRAEAIAAKSKVYSNFPELKTYLIYQSPYFRVKAGNFKERQDAEDYQKKLIKYFPKGVFIMNDTIEVRPDKDDTNTSRF